MRKSNRQWDSIECESLITCFNLLFNLTGQEINQNKSQLSASNCRQLITEFNQANTVSLTLKRVRFSNIEKIPLPIVYFDKNYGSVVLANLSTEKALIQSPDAASPEIISREELKARWSGK